MTTEEDWEEWRINYIEVQKSKGAETEPIKFTKFVDLRPELRHHILTYFKGYPSGLQLSMYSQCSNSCNLDVQRFNTIPPQTILMTDIEGGIEVEMWYKKKRDRTKTVIKKFMYNEVDNVMEEIEMYLMSIFKYVGKKNTLNLWIDMKQWPRDLMRMKNIVDITYWSVTIYQSMYHDFMEFIKTIDIRSERLTLYDCKDVTQRCTIRSDFFKSDVFRNLPEINVKLKCEIDKDDFINLKNKHVYLTSSISFDDIRTIVRKWNNETHSVKSIERVVSSLLSIKLPKDDDRVLDQSVIFPPDQFDVRVTNSGLVAGLGTGKVHINIDTTFRTLKLWIRREGEFMEN